MVHSTLKHSRKSRCLSSSWLPSCRCSWVLKKNVGGGILKQDAKGPVSESPLQKIACLRVDVVEVSKNTWMLLFPNFTHQFFILAIFSFDTFFFCWRGHTKTAMVRDLFQNPPSSLLEGEFWNRLLWDLFHNPPPMRRTLFGGGGIVEQVPYGSVSVSTRHGGGTLFSRKMWGMAGAFWNITIASKLKPRGFFHKNSLAENLPLPALPLHSYVAV